MHITQDCSKAIQLHADYCFMPCASYPCKLPTAYPPTVLPCAIYELPIVIFALISHTAYFHLAQPQAVVALPSAYVLLSYAAQLRLLHNSCLV